MVQHHKGETQEQRLDQNLRVLYVCILGSSVLATSLLVCPVAFHRTLFRRGERAWLVHASHLAARAGLAAT